MHDAPLQTAARKDCFNRLHHTAQSVGAEQINIKRAIIHWYTGDLESLKKFIEAGYYFSVNSNMCVTSKGRRIISEIPLNRLLVESDGPFTKVGACKYTPANLRAVYSVLATTVGTQNIENIIFENFNRLLTL